MTKVNQQELRARLKALETLVAGEPPYPAGTLVRHLQDERDKARTLLGDS